MNMKKKTLQFLIANLFCFMFTQFSISSNLVPFVEIYVRNYLNVSVFAKLYPVSSVFNGKSTVEKSKFSLLNSYFLNVPRIGPTGNAGPDLKYQVGLDGYALTHRGTQSGFFEIVAPEGEDLENLYNALYIDHNSSPSEFADATIGYGVYRLELWVEDHPPLSGLPLANILLDYTDFNYAYGGVGGLATDLEINIRATTSGGVKFKWVNSSSEEISFADPNLPINERNSIKCYKQYQNYLNGSWVIKETTPNTGISAYGLSKSDELLYPIDGTEISDPVYRVPRHDNSGKLCSPLYIDFNHQAKIKCDKIFEVTSNNLLWLKGNSSNTGTRFTIGNDPNSTNCGATFVNDPNATVIIDSYSQFIVESNCKLILDCDSKTFIRPNAQLIMKQGSIFCNKGGIIGSGQITFQGKVRRPFNCNSVCLLPRVKDSIKFVLENGAELEIPDSTTYVFEGSETALICKDSSSIKFGKGSKLVFQGGAKINADGCKFTSYDSADTWDGIYLIDNANDTLKNCTFENAYNGININPDFAAPLVDTHTTIIQNCKFRNSTTGTLLSQVFINDADCILIDNCTTESSIATGYSTGYVLQYSASNGVVITNNTLNNCGIGITAIQSSPYIARNVITGQTASGTGIYLDNSNGTIEYNRVYNFEKSIEGSYSSPYLLKNTLSDASLQSIALTNNSVPVLRPVVSGSAVRWLGGNNRITGSPVYGAFNFSKDCYPMIDSGYNVIHVTNADYVMADLDDDYYATFNNWYDNPPITSLFNVQGGSLYYDPVFDGTTLPTTDYFELNSLGFDMYDSVFVKNIGDNPGAGTLFMQAYTNESQGNYNTAINLYKDVIAGYRNTEYAPVSLARIFNSLEKNNSNSSAYGQIQAYYTGIKTDTTHTPESREIAEDFVIKAKVKQDNVSEAIADYENIYHLNQNTPKGTHALVNKMCLENMLQGLTDDPNEPVKLNPNKAELLAFLTRNITSNSQATLNNKFPTSFRLYQNYPNPFNPQTTIRFDVPKDAMVLVKIYDLLGREVFNYSGYQTAGTHELKFDGSNYASGMYFYSVETNGFNETKKMVLLK